MKSLLFIPYFTFQQTEVIPTLLLRFTQVEFSNNRNSIGKCLSPKPSIRPTLPMVNNKLQLLFFGSKFCTVPHKLVTFMPYYIFSLSKVLRFHTDFDKVSHVVF